MDSLVLPLHIRWADLDPNFHVRHSVYYDFGAQYRVDLLNHLGINTEVMTQQHFGPVLFREECLFRREIRYGSDVFISAKIAKMRRDGSRWTFRHELTDGKDKTYAILTAEGAWLDLHTRKLANPVPEIVTTMLDRLPKTEDFEWLD